MSDTSGAIKHAYRTLRLERDGPIDWLTLDRPERLNAMDLVMCGELQDYFGGLSADLSARVVILRGAGRAFCSGFDLKSRPARLGACACSGM
jgi:enoyl-CoA hydratase/carnithine racemase